MMGLQPPRGVTWEEVARSLQLSANRRQNKNMCDVCYFSLCSLPCNLSYHADLSSVWRKPHS